MGIAIHTMTIAFDNARKASPAIKSSHANGNNERNSGDKSSQGQEPLRERMVAALRQQQRLLLLLRHSCNCPHPLHACPVTPYCGETKATWDHIIGCSGDCDQTHCKRAKFVLFHFGRCTIASCPLCGPMRQSMREIREHTIQFPPRARAQFN